jgi:hypothetical protein
MCVYFLDVLCSYAVVVVCVWMNKSLYDCMRTDVAESTLSLADKKQYEVSLYSVTTS